MPDFFQTHPSQAVLLQPVTLRAEQRTQGFVFRKAFGQVDHLIHHETQSCVCNLSVVAPALTYSQTKITTAFLEYDIYAPSSFVKFIGADEVYGGICSKQHFPMSTSPIFDDEDASGLIAQLCMKLNVFTLILSAIA